MFDKIIYIRTKRFINKQKISEKKKKEVLKNFEKIINEKNIEKDKRANYINTKEFKEQLNLFLLREEHNSKQKAKEISESLEENKKEKNEKLKELNKVNELLKNIHANKKRDIDELYFHYLNLLKEGIDTRNEGLSWIIKEIFKMDKNGK